VFTVVIVSILNSQIPAAWVVLIQFADDLDFVSVHGAACHPLRVYFLECEHVI
jgi:hypothetical protein